MTAVPTMKTAAREIPSELIPSIGTGWASTNVAASRSAQTPARTAGVGSDVANATIAIPRIANPASATGTSMGKRRAISREAKGARLTSPDALSAERTGRMFTVMRYQFAVLPGPPFQVAQESGQKGSHDCNVYQLCLPMQHLDPLPMSDAYDDPSI